MLTVSAQTIEILYPGSVGAARRTANAMAENIGFDPATAEEIAIAINELGTNLIKHARDGALILTPLAAGGRVGLEIESRDSGPGITDVEQALTDRYSTTGTRGTGLGAVNRLMTELEIASEPGQGTRIVCRKWLRHHHDGRCRCPLAFGIATRPRPPGLDNGDAFILKQWGESVLVGVIDGLGHGQLAHQAAQAARQYADSHFDQPLDQIFLGVGRACHATRGVVMALARFDWGREQLTFASVGNIETRVFPDSKPFSFIVRRGVIGLNAPKAIVTEHDWPAAGMLVLHSDGLRTHWSWNDFPGLAEQPAQAIAGELLRLLGKDEDDATVLVVRTVLP